MEVFYESENRKVVLIGAGMVGWALLINYIQVDLCEELGLIDFLRSEKLKGKQWTLKPRGSLVPPIKVTSGGYEQCADADVIVIAGGLPQNQVKLV